MARRTGITKNVGKTRTTYTVRWKERAGTDAFGLTVWKDAQETFPSEAAAKAFAARRTLGLAAATSAEPLAAYMARWFARMARVWSTEATSYRREAAWRLHGASELGPVRLKDLTRERVQAVYDGLADRGYAPATIATLHACLGMALDAAVDDGLIGKNPVRGARPPAARTAGSVRRLSPAQAARFEAAVRGDPWEALFVLLLRNCLRIGEALALRWDDLDLDRGTAQIARTQTTTRTGKTATRPGAKTDRGNRRAPLLPPVVAALARHRTAQRLARLAAPIWHDPGLVFSTRDGRPLLRQNVNARLAAVLAAAGLPRLSSHGFRHTGATLAILAGVPMRVVQEMLGHASIQTTMDVYGHVDEGQVRAAQERIDLLLRAAGLTDGSLSEGGDGRS